MTNLKEQWIRHCLDLSSQKADFYTGCRKILRGKLLEFTLDPSLKISDAGYTQSKLTMLKRLYLHEESREMARQLWERRLGQETYGSIGFTTYNHLLKNDPDKKSKRASVMGPCLQSVVLTYISKKESPQVDVFYRTTELLKKFPADLVFLRDTLLDGFELKRRSVSCHFANITVHPMYFITILPSIDNPIKELDRIKSKDKYFYDWVVKWSARYICKQYSRGIDKFSQALRVRKDAFERIDKKKLKVLQDYFVDNHPGYRNEYVDPEGEDDPD